MSVIRQVVYVTQQRLEEFTKLLQFALIFCSPFFSHKIMTISLHLSVILFTGGVCLSACWDITPPPRDHAHHPGPCTPPRDHAPSSWDQAHPPQDHAPPPAHSMLGDTVNARAVRILLQCNLVHLFYCNLDLPDDPITLTKTDINPCVYTVRPRWVNVNII